MWVVNIRNLRKFSIEEQMKLHQDNECIDFISPINYHWFIKPISEFVPDQSYTSVYSGRSSNGICPEEIRQIKNWKK